MPALLLVWLRTFMTCREQEDVAPRHTPVQEGVCVPAYAQALHVSLFDKGSCVKYIKLLPVSQK